MPLYPFKHPHREDYIEEFFHMNDDKRYVDDEGVEWNRVFMVPNISATYRSFDEKRLVDENGKPARVAHLSEGFVRSQGFKNADDYIEYNNSVMVDPTKTPTRNLEKAHEQADDKNLQEQLREQQQKLIESNKAAEAKKNIKTVSQICSTATTTSEGKVKSVKHKSKKTP